jgi:hypothetical protein
MQIEKCKIAAKGVGKMTLQFALCNLHFEMLYSRCASLALREI